MIFDNPYAHTSDDVIFTAFAIRNNIPENNQESARRQFFSKLQVCMRSSPLGKRYGWGVHSDAEGKIAVYPLESEEYKRFAGDTSLKHTRAMRSHRK